MKLIATYGSLKREFYNHGRMGEQVYLGNMVVRGLMSLVYGAYPRLFLTEDGGEHEVEVFEVREETFEALDMMEVSAGYVQTTINTPFGEATMWVVESEDMLGGERIEAYTRDVIDIAYE